MSLTTRKAARDLRTYVCSVATDYALLRIILQTFEVLMTLCHDITTDDYELTNTPYLLSNHFLYLIEYSVIK